MISLGSATVKTLGILIGIFIVALVLAISPDFFSQIHLQCILIKLFKINCPLCGMTRDFILLAKDLHPKFNMFSMIFAWIIFVVYPLGVGYCVFKKHSVYLPYKLVRNIFICVMSIMLIVNNLG